MTIQEYLQSKKIKLHYPGEKNVTRGWINFKCIFSDCSDESWHLGVNLNSHFFNCHMCGHKGYIISLIQKIEKCSYQRAEEIAASIDDPIENKREKKRSKKIIKNILPDCNDILPSCYRDYLISRNFDPDYLIKKYSIMSTKYYNFSKYRFRIICPIIMNGKIVNFIAASVKRKTITPPYVFCPDNRANIPINECIYNIDTIEDKVFIVEGITDVWRGGDSFIGTFGKNFSLAQIKLLLKKGVKKANIMYDSDADKKADELANLLSGFMEVNINYFKEGIDPALMSESELKNLKIKK